MQDLCLIPEVPFYLHGPGGLIEFVHHRLRENGHMVIVVAEGAGQELMAETMGSLDKMNDASGNKLLLDVGLWLCNHLKVRDNKLNSLLWLLQFKCACCWFGLALTAHCENFRLLDCEFINSLQEHFLKAFREPLNLKYIGTVAVNCSNCWVMVIRLPGLHLSIFYTVGNCLHSGHVHGDLAFDKTAHYAIVLQIRRIWFEQFQAMLRTMSTAHCWLIAPSMGLWQGIAASLSDQSTFDTATFLLL